VCVCVCVRVRACARTRACTCILACEVLQVFLYPLGSVGEIKCGPAKNLNLLHYLVLRSFQFSVGEELRFVEQIIL
jgi:hypothetical protein